MFSDDCRKAREALAQRLSERSVSDPGPFQRTGTDQGPAREEPPEWLSSHLAECPSCRRELGELEELDRALWRNMAHMRERIAPPSEETVRETVRRALERPAEVEYLRRIRRTVRALLWGTFFALVLLAACALAVALYKALRAPP